jgi:cell division protein ZapA
MGENAPARSEARQKPFFRQGVKTASGKDGFPFFYQTMSIFWGLQEFGPAERIGCRSLHGVKEGNNMSKNKLSVEIYGQQYNIIGKASPGYMREVARQVDENMRTIAQGNPRLDTTKLAVLSAVNITDQYLKLKQEYEEIMHLIEDDQP